MELREAQRVVARFVEAQGLEGSLEVRLLDLASEVGELARESLTGTRYGRGPFQPSAAWADEVGDAFFALICLANASGVDLQASLEGVMAKYRRRLAERGSPGSGR
ncbi:MAG: MazG nucleotide pyrophosphohydrolase domain-containing protein [Armatimonadota bacterium]|nr:MazG nucleotide pyrophosphohydrolase domain-containing protein [Armatimonadota bacterium]MDR7548787.1 MazG nucleotide pyrophosphohydrolase domain-containing protein [Armatimonadota bacterium]